MRKQQAYNINKRNLTLLNNMKDILCNVLLFLTENTITE